MRRMIDFRNGLHVAGHPLHAVLVHFPLALWSLVFPLEIVGWWTGWETSWLLAYAANAAGLCFAVPTLLSGLPELMTLSKKPKESALANLHMMVMLGAMTFFAIELYLRHGPGPESGSGLFVTLGLSGLGTMVLVWGGWLGAELVFRYGVGRE